MEIALVAKKFHANLALGSRISQPKAEKGAHQGSWLLLRRPAQRAARSFRIAAALLPLRRPLAAVYV